MHNSLNIIFLIIEMKTFNVPQFYMSSIVIFKDVDKVFLFSTLGWYSL
jgi:hypothetical protein